MTFPWDETGFFVELLFSDEFLDVIDSDRLIDRTTGAMEFAWMIANASADSWEWFFVFDEGECWAACRTDTSLSPKEGKVRNSPLALSIIRFLYHHKYGSKYNQYID